MKILSLFFYPGVYVFQTDVCFQFSKCLMELFVQVKEAFNDPSTRF